MGSIKVCNINSSCLVDGSAFPIFGVSDPEMPEDNTIIFAKKGLCNYANLKNSIIISDKTLDVNESNCLIIDDNPKNRFAEILSKLKENMEDYQMYDDGCNCISKDFKLGENSAIGRNCIIEGDVLIGNNCIIGDYVKICAHTRIGKNVIINNRCTIGIEDADIYRRGGELEECLTLPHLAGTIIGDGCLLLDGATVSAGDTRATTIDNGTMLGIGAHIGHNCIIGKRSLIGAFSCISGHCNIGKDVYVAPNSVVSNRLNVGDEAYIGIGSVVISDVGEGEKVFGNPALKLPKYTAK